VKNPLAGNISVLLAKDMGNMQEGACFSPDGNIKRSVL